MHVSLALAGLDKIEASINGVLGSLPGAFSTPDFDADKLAADILRDNRVAMLPVDFMKLMDSANINFSITELSRVGTAGATTGFDRMLQDFEKASTVMENMRLFDSLDRTIDSYKKMLAEADKQTAKGVADSLLKEGFKQSGADWTRRAIVDATIWGAQWDTQVVPGYEFYTPPEFQYNIKADGATFTPDKLAAMSTAEVQALATAARINLKKQFDSLMGDDADDPQNKQSLQYHIGKVPSVDDGKVKWSTGLGQMKDVIGTMIDKNIQKARGEAKANGPFWSKPLWDSDKDNDGSNDGFFGAPNIMTIAKIAVSVAGGGPWLSFALDAFDTAYNVAAGNMSLKDGAIGLAKGAAVATVSSLGVTSFIGNAVGTATAGLGSVVSSTLSAVAQNYSSSLINGAINAFNGENGWSLSSFKQSAKDGLKGAAIAGTTALVGGLINSANGQTFGKYKNPNGKEGFGWHTSQSGVLDNMSSSISSIGNYWGGLAGQAMSAALGEGFTLNILNARDLGIGDGGLLEMRFGGKQPMSFGIGSGGADVSRSIMNQMDAGFRQLDFMKKVNSSESLSGLETQAQLAKINMMRWAGGKAAQLAELEVGGMIRSFYNAGDYNSSRGMMTTLGLNDIEVDEKGNITLASQARLAVRQTHESTHVLQNIASYNSGVSMTAMDREMDAHGAGIAAWQGLLDTFGSGLASTGSGTMNDRRFASEMSGLSLAMANNQLDKYLKESGYDVNGQDWNSDTHAGFYYKGGVKPQKGAVYVQYDKNSANLDVSVDENGKQYGTYTWATTAGFSSDEAKTIGKNNMDVDDLPFLRSEGTGQGNHLNRSAEIKWIEIKVVSPSGEIETRKICALVQTGEDSRIDASRTFANRALDALFSNNDQDFLKYIGYSSHPLQDYYGHLNYWNGYGMENGTSYGYTPHPSAQRFDDWNNSPNNECRDLTEQRSMDFFSIMQNARSEYQNILRMHGNDSRSANEALSRLKSNVNSSLDVMYYGMKQDSDRYQINPLLGQNSIGAFTFINYILTPGMINQTYSYTHVKNIEYYSYNLFIEQRTRRGHDAEMQIRYRYSAPSW